MQVLFLGTSSGWPLPRLGCNCEICTSSDPKDKRSRPSILVDERILIDASFDVYWALQSFKIDPTKIETVLITHGHDDHFYGLYDLSHTYRRKEKPKVITTKGVLSAIREKLGISLLSFKVQEAKPLEKVELGHDSYAWFIPVEHGKVEAYGIKVKAPKPIFYAPEFRRILPSAKREVGDVDLAIIDGSSKTSLGQARGHETIEEGIRLGKEIHAKRILFTNIGHKTDEHAKLEKFVKEKGGEKFGIAFDGLELEV